MTDVLKLCGTYRSAVSRGQIELACALQPLLTASLRGDKVVQRSVDEVVEQLLYNTPSAQHQDSTPDQCAPLYVALRLLYNTNVSGLDTNIELVQGELLLRQNQETLSDTTLSFIRTIVFSSQEFNLQRRIGNYITLNPTLLDVCQHIPRLPTPFLNFFNKMIVERAGLEETFQSTLVNCLRRIMQKNSTLPTEELIRYLTKIESEHMAPDVRSSLNSCIVHFLEEHSDNHSTHLYRTCLAGLLDTNNAKLLAAALKEVRENARATINLSEHLQTSFETFAVAALYNTLDRGTSFVEEVLHLGLQHLRKGEYEAVRRMFGDTPLRKLKPLLLAMIFDKVDTHREQAVLLEELSYNTSGGDRFVRSVFSSVRDQVEVGRWCEEQVKPLLKNSWNSTAAATVTSSRSILQVILALNCIEKLGQHKVLALMFNVKDTTNTNDLPLSDALTLDQGKDIVTFCSAMVVLNIVCWLHNQSRSKDGRFEELALAEKHLSRVFPLYNRAEVLNTAFSAMIHALKQPNCQLTMQDCGDLVEWFEKQLAQFSNDEAALSFGYFDTVKIFRDLSFEAPNHQALHQTIKEAVVEAKWRVALLKTLTEARSRKRRELNRLAASHLLSFLSSTPQDLMRLCLISDNTEKATETLHRYDMRTTHLARVVEFQNNYARCTKELERFGASWKKQQQANTQNTANLTVMDTGIKSSRQGSGNSPNSRGRTASVSSTSSSITSTVSTVSRALSISNVSVTLRNVATAAARSGERSRVPAIVSKLTSTVTRDQLMIECETFDVDNETLIARLLTDMGCTISAPKPVGLQLISLALDRLQDNIVPDSLIETYTKKLHSILKMLDAKPYPGISVATSSPREYLNSIYPCISNDVLHELLEFNENQAVTYRDLRNAINDKGPLDVVRMEGALESARDVLNLNNYTTFLSTHDKHRDYLGTMICYLTEYTKRFNISLEDTPHKVHYSPSDIFSRSPEYHIGELVLQENVHPRLLAEAAEYVSVDMLQLLVISSFPQVCLEEEAVSTTPPCTITLPSPLPESDDDKAALILTYIHRLCSGLPHPKHLPLHVLLTHLETCQVTLDNSTSPSLDLIRLLTDTISPYKPISALKPSKFNPLYLLGLLLPSTSVEFSGPSLEKQVQTGCKCWLGIHAYISCTSELLLSLHPLILVAIILLKQRRRRGGDLKEFYCLYTQTVCEFLGGEIETMLGCSRAEITVREKAGVFYLCSDTKSVQIVTSSSFDYNYITTCTKCKDINNDLQYRSVLKPLTSAFDFVKGHSECLATLGYLFNALDARELYGAGLIIDDTLLAYPALHQYVALRAEPYIRTVDSHFVDLMGASSHKAAVKQDLIGCQLFGGRQTGFLVHTLSSMVEFNLQTERYAAVFEILSSDAAREIYGEKIPDLIILLALDKRSPEALDSLGFLAQFLNMQDKLLGLEFARERYQGWHVAIATKCFAYFSEVLAHEPDCISMILSCLDRLNTMRRISKILNYLEISLTTCTTIEEFIHKRSEDFTQLMTAHKEFAVCHSAIKLGVLSGEYEARLLAEHVIFMAQNDNYDSLDIYNLLENRVNLEVCETLCSMVQQHTNNLKIVLQLIDIILDKFQTLLSREKRISLMKQRLGAQCYREIKLHKVANYEEYSQLLFRPLILLEQLIMNYQIHTAAMLVEKHSAEFAECDLTASLDRLIRLYIGKALYYEGARKSDTTSGSTVYSTLSRVTTRSMRKPLTVFDPPFKGSSRTRRITRNRREVEQYPIPSSPAPWVDEKKIKRCQICRTKFTFLIRKHHCRWCGRVLCDKCAALRAPTSYFGASVRLCKACFFAIQEGRYSTGGDEGDIITEDMNTLYSPPFEVLSTNAIYNIDTRDSYSFTTAPTSELCLYLSRMLSPSCPPGDVLLPLCESLSETFMESVALEGDRYYSHVLVVIDNVLKEARNCFRARGISNKVEETNIYIAYTHICRRLPLSDLSNMPAMKSLLKFDTLHNTYMGLLDKQYPQMAISLCTTARQDPLGLWRRWGFRCLRAGDYHAARDKLEMCLKNKQFNQAILDEIINHLENCLPSFLAEITDVTELISDIRRKCKKQKLNTAEFDECVYYLSIYSSPILLLQFYIKHNSITRAAELALQHESDVVYEGVVRPLIKTGRLSALFDYINSNRGQMEVWEMRLSECCKLLSEVDLTSVYTVQFFLEEYLNAAKTLILMLRNELSVSEQMKYLDKAEGCFKAYLEKKGAANEAVIPQVNTRLSHIHLQRKILEFLKFKQIKDNDSNIHIFSSNSDKTTVVKELYRIDSVESLPVIRAIRDTFSKSYAETYQPLINHLLEVHTTGNISLWFPRLIKILGEIPDGQTDDILLKVCADLKGEQKSFERILAIMKDDKTKIRANVNAGFLRNAYILAVNKKMVEEIRWLEEECERQGNTQVKEFCRKYLQHNNHYK